MFVQEEMLDGYQAGALECGPGCFVRMKAGMTTYIDANKKRIFQNPCRDLQADLKALKVEKSSPFTFN